MAADALLVARHVATHVVAEGAEAVVLVGSAATGQAHPLSDIDLYAIGEKHENSYRVASGRLVSVSIRRAEDVRASFRDPPQIGQAVPAWQSAVILEDRTGIGKALQREAREFEWAPIAASCDAYVAEAFHGYAEEVLKLVYALRTGSASVAAVQRNVIALRLPGLLAIHLRLLYRTENVLWECVASEMGDDWRKVQSAAFAEDGGGIGASSGAALEMFRLAARQFDSLLSSRQREVVQVALLAMKEIE